DRGYLKNERIIRGPIFIGLLVFVISMLFVPKGFAAESSSSLVPIKIQLRWYHQFQFAGYYAAKEKGYYRDAGFDVEIIEGKPGKRPIDEVLSGRAQFGTGNSEILYKKLQGEPLVALSVIGQHSPAILLTKADSGIKTPEDLVGKKVMMIGDSPNVDFLAMFESEGIKLNDLNVIESSYNVQDLIDGKIAAFNAYSTNEPYILKKMGIATHSLSPISYGVDFYSDILFTNESQVKSSLKQTKKFVNASIRGWEYALANPDEIIDLILEKYKTKKSREHLEYEARELRRLINPDTIPVGHMNPERWERMADLFVQYKLIPKEYNLGQFVFNPTEKGEQDGLKYLLLIILSIAAIAIIIALIFLFLYTRLKKAVDAKFIEEQKMRSSEMSFRNIISNLQDIYYRTDTDGLIQYASSSAYRVLGYKPKKMIGLKLSDFYVDPNGREKFISALQQNGGSILGYQLEFRSSDGRSLWLSANAQYYRNETGEIIGVEGTVRDITDFKLLEDSLRTAKNLSDKSSRDKSEFLANMSHEIRTPLNGLNGFANILSETELTFEQQEYIDVIKSTTNELSHIINDILDLSRIETGHLAIVTKPTNINNLIKEVVNLFSIDAKRKGLELHTESSNIREKNIVIDPLRVKEILTNLLSNAIKYTQEGRVTLATTLNKDRDGSYRLIIDVSDTGVGISNREQLSIFSAFTRVENMGESNIPGIGLGLAITKRVVELMGGSISLNSSEGEGSCFSVIIPCAIIAESTEVGEAKAKDEGSYWHEIPTNVVILVVDDNSINRKFITTVLKKNGIQLLEAENGEEAVKLVENKNIDLVLMDVRMPIMDGVEATRYIRNMGSEKSITPIVALTAHAQKDDLDEFERSGMNDVLIKPVDADKLSKVIYEQLVPNRKA
ncbi:MAG: ABC transporter substrate-binding protein, partial [Chromatiales bacterium]|nr:ABC transporter substrate-binding protein [Chromatiales bacterium]